MTGPVEGETPGLFAGYIGLVQEDDLLAAMQAEFVATVGFLRSIPAEKELTLHPPYTWTSRQVIGHIVDAERVFAYRALRFGRADETPLPGFDEGPYMASADFNRLPLPELIPEYSAVRTASLALYRHFPEAAWTRKGQASTAVVSVRTLARVIVGHERHHMNILRKRFGASR